MIQTSTFTDTQNTASYGYTPSVTSIEETLTPALMEKIDAFPSQKSIVFSAPDSFKTFPQNALSISLGRDGKPNTSSERTSVPLTKTEQSFPHPSTSFAQVIQEFESGNGHDRRGSLVLAAVWLIILP